LDQRVLAAGNDEIGDRLARRRARALPGRGGLAGAHHATLGVYSVRWICFTSAEKAWASRTARSARTLRFTSIPARRSPWIRRLKERPCGLAAALIRAIHSRPKSRLRARR